MSEGSRRDLDHLPVRVECYAGYKADERPLRFALEGETRGWVTVKRVTRQWYEPAAECFAVEGEDGRAYRLRRDIRSGCWTLEAGSGKAATRRLPGRATSPPE